MSDYEVYEEGTTEIPEEMSIPRDNYGTADPNVMPTKIPCGGCGAHLHCQVNVHALERWRNLALSFTSFSLRASVAEFIDSWFLTERNFPQMCEGRFLQSNLSTVYFLEALQHRAVCIRRPGRVSQIIVFAEAQTLLFTSRGRYD